jgi:spore maturation protein SpmB
LLIAWAVSGSCAMGVAADQARVQLVDSHFRVIAARP